MDINKILDFESSRYYGDLIMAFFEFLAIIMGIKYGKGLLGKMFLGYLLFDFITLLIFLFLISSSDDIRHANQANNFIHFMTPLISLVELCVYYFFFSKILNASAKVLLICLFSVFFTLTLLFIITGFGFLNANVEDISYVLSIIEFLSIAVPCFIYFFHLIATTTVLPLFGRPSFWIATGIFFYSSISIPYYFILILLEPNYLFKLYIPFFVLPFSEFFMSY